MTAPASPTAPCGCPKSATMIRHLSPICTDRVVARLGWYADRPVDGKPPRVEFTDPIGRLVGDGERDFDLDRTAKPS